MSTYSLATSATRFNYWYNGSNKGLCDQTHSQWNSTAARQLAYSTYTSNYYTTYMKFGTSTDIANTNANYYPTAIKITCTRNNSHGSHGSSRTARFGCVSASAADGVSGLSIHNDISVLPVSSGSQTYTITTNLAQAQTYVNVLAAGGYFTLGCNTKPTSSTAPMSTTHYLGLNYSGMTLTIDWATRATSCSAPTAVTISSTVGTPNQSVTISWSGAKAGTNNAISGYRVFWRDGAVPTTSTYTSYKDVTSSSTSGSTTITTSNTRGTTRYFKVQTKGAYGTSYWSGISSASDNILTNTLPTITSASPATNTVFVSTTTTFSFTSFSGAANGGYSSLSYKYALSSTGTKYTCTTSTAITLPAGSTTYYIWAYDGYEYSSSYITRTYTKNVAPTVTLGAITTPSISTQGAPDTGYTYATRLSTTTTSNKTGTYYFQYLIGTTWRDLTNNSTGTLSDIILSNLTGVTAGTKIEQLRVRIYDGYEYSSYDTEDIKVHIIPGPTTSDGVYNQYSSSNVPSTNSSHFYQKVRVYYRGDMATTAVGYIINTETEILSTSFAKGSSSSKGFVNLNLSSVATQKNGSYTIKIILYRDGLKTTLPTITLTRTNIPTFDNITSIDTSLGANGIRPHTADGTFNMSFVNIFQSSSPDYINTFDMSQIMTNNLEVKLVYGNNYVPVQYNSSLSSDTITLTLNANLITDAVASNLGITNYYGTYVIGVQLNLKNSFNELSTKTFNNVFTLNFTEEFPMSSSDFSVELNNTSITNGIFIRRGDKVDFNVNFKSYNCVVTTFQPQIARVDATGTGIPLETDWSNYGTVTKVTPGAVQSIGVKWTESRTFSVTVDEISQSKYVYFRIKITNTLNKEIKCTSSIYGRSIRHSAASGLSISDLKFTRNNESDCGNITIAYSSSNSGLHVIDNYALPRVTGTATLEFSSTSNFEVVVTSITTPWKILNTYSNIQQNFTNVSKTELIGSKIPNTGWNFYYARIKLVTRDENEALLDITKTTYSPPFLIYNISPTVSYRSNQVGINYDLQSDSGYSDGIMIISENNSKNKIYLISASDSPVLDSYIELVNGHIIFDGGTWD